MGEPTLEIEFLAGLTVRVGRDWRAVEPNRHEPVTLQENTVDVPERLELAALLRTFARAKDLQRAKALMRGTRS